MNPRHAEPTAVFHRREAMEHAVYALVEKGVSPKRIQISQGSAAETGDRVRTAPERGGVLIVGLAIGAAAGATLALVWMYWLSHLVFIPAPLIALRTLGGAASGALVGALLAVLVYAFHQSIRDEPNAPTGEFVVKVRTPSESAAENVRESMSLHGGRLLPSSP